MCLRDHTKTLTLELPFLRSLAISSNRKKRPPSTPPPPSPTGGGPKRLIVADHIRGIRSPNDVLLEMPPVGYAGGVLAGVPARLPATRDTRDGFATGRASPGVSEQVTVGPKKPPLPAPRGVPPGAEVAAAVAPEVLSVGDHRRHLANGQDLLEDLEHDTRLLDVCGWSGGWSATGRWCTSFFVCASQTH